MNKKFVLGFTALLLCFAPYWGLTTPAWAATYYPVTVQNDGNGTASANPTKAATGTQVTITATPGGQFKQWVVVSGGVTLSNTTANPATFSMPASNVTIRAEFEPTLPSTYSVTMQNDGNGSASASSASATAGATVTITATPSAGYQFKQWVVVSGGATLSSTTTNPDTFTMPSNAVTIKAEFELIPPTSATITSANNTRVTRGTGGSFTVTATGTAPIIYSLNGTVPTGVSINGSSGEITIAGTTAAGTHTFTIIASNGTLPDATQGFTLYVDAYAIGDVYPYLGAPMGVVVSVSNGGLNGKFISLDEGRGDLSAAGTWCTNHGAGWYLPSQAEMTSVLQNNVAINGGLAGISATQLRLSSSNVDHHWTSTVDIAGSGPDYNFAVYWDGANVQSVSTINSNTRYYRAICGF
ncbi:MAG: hypothetical protein FWG72_11040 [Oscillospiraceae bacterium]|nr:hypothetical protein [Oscillospiraceae bacterium]